MVVHSYIYGIHSELKFCIDYILTFLFACYLSQKLIFNFQARSLSIFLYEAGFVYKGCILRSLLV